ncbi:MAG: hypothetical protein LBS79_02275, partial [Tannerella sp.]|nr:hypothetical protein [Tannerella sp.]
MTGFSKIIFPGLLLSGKDEGEAERFGRFSRILFLMLLGGVFYSAYTAAQDKSDAGRKDFDYI